MPGPCNYGFTSSSNETLMILHHYAIVALHHQAIMISHHHAIMPSHYHATPSCNLSFTSFAIMESYLSLHHIVTQSMMAPHIIVASHHPAIMLSHHHSIMLSHHHAIMLSHHRAIVLSHHHAIMLSHHRAINRCYDATMTSRGKILVVFSLFSVILRYLHVVSV